MHRHLRDNTRNSASFVRTCKTNMANFTDDVNVTYIRNVVSIVFSADTNSSLLADDVTHNASYVTNISEMRSSSGSRLHEVVSIVATLAVPLPLILISLMSNARTLLILLRQPFRQNPHTFYLAAMSASYLVHSIFKTIDVIELFEINITARAFTCPLTEITKDTTTFLEAWLPVCFALDRMIVAQRAGLASDVGRKAHSVVAVLLLMAVVVYFNKSPIMLPQLMSDGRLMCRELFYRRSLLLASMLLNNILPSIVIIPLVTIVCCTRDVHSSNQERATTYTLLIGYVMFHLPAAMVHLAYFTLPDDMVSSSFMVTYALLQLLPQVYNAFFGLAIVATCTRFRRAFCALRNSHSTSNDRHQTGHDLEDGDEKTPLRHATNP